jgi:cytochrome P450
MALRHVEPFARVNLWDGTSPYLLTNHGDIKAVLTDQRFSCEPVREGFPHVFEGRKVADIADRSFLRLDNPEHDRLRRMVTKEFTVRRIEGIRPRIEETVDRLITEFAALPQGSDFVEHFSGPLPTEVITFLLGVPYDDHELFHRATRIPVLGQIHARGVRESIDELFAYLDHLITVKEADPQNRIISRLVHEQLVPGNIDRDTLINVVRLLLQRRPPDDPEHDRSRGSDVAAASRPTGDDAIRPRPDRQRRRGTTALFERAAHGRPPRGPGGHRGQRPSGASGEG